jgi:isopentenyl-diphosphate Delta-isomerase
MDIKEFEVRKREHIQHSLDSAHQAEGLNGLDQVHLIHDALPNINFDEIELTTSCLGHTLSTPFYIAGMTAGHDDAFALNRTFALACQQRGWAMGVGSQRRDLEASSHNSLDQWKKLREEVPHLILFANIGISQLIEAKLSLVRQLVKELGAQALVVHVNALQEAIQIEGTPRFKGSWIALKELCENSEFPVVLKETGCGFSRRTLDRVAPLGLAAIDISGLGGTHWGRIEGARAAPDSIRAQAALTFANWGESTAQSVRDAVKALPKSEIWASGGVRSGLDAAKLIALGAHRVGYAKPALQAALRGAQALLHWMELQEFELKVGLFCTGSIDCDDLRRKEQIC